MEEGKDKRRSDRFYGEEKEDSVDALMSDAYYNFKESLSTTNPLYQMYLENFGQISQSEIDQELIPDNHSHLRLYCPKCIENH